MVNILVCLMHHSRSHASVGRFLLGILTDLHKWHTDEQTYVLENRTKIGGKYVQLPGLQRALSNKPNENQLYRSWIRLQR